MSDGMFEALNYALRKSRDGVIVSFVVHPSDVTPELMSLPIGARVAVKWAALTDDEKHITNDDEPPSVQASSPFATDASTAAPQGGEETAAPAKSKQRKQFASLPLSQQCAMRCNEPEFQRWVGCDGTESTSAWAHSNIGGSRKLLDTNILKAMWWRETESAYQSHVATLQHQDLVR